MSKKGLNQDSNLRPLGYEPNALLFLHDQLQQHFLQLFSQSPEIGRSTQIDRTIQFLTQSHRYLSSVGKGFHHLLDLLPHHEGQTRHGQQTEPVSESGSVKRAGTKRITSNSLM